MKNRRQLLARATIGVCVVVLVGLAPVVARAEGKPPAGLPVKVYLMAGQSNMVGHASAKYIQENYPELAKARPDVWCVSMGKISGPLRPGFGGGENSFGIELVMGKVLGDAAENPIVLFKSSTGGTTLHKDWRPPSAVAQSGGQVGQLYTLMIKRFHNMLGHCEQAFGPFAGRPVELAGFVWFQGENDSLAKDANGVGYWEYYEQNLKDLITDVRRDVGVPELPVLVVQINDGTWDGPGKGGAIIREIEKKVAEADGHAAWIKTCDLGRGYHYDSPSFVTMGRRAGEALLPFIRKAVPQKPADVAAARKRFLAQFPKPGKPDTSSLAKGLIGYWRFDECAGEKAADSSGAAKGLDGALKGGAIWVAGRVGKGAVMLTGSQTVEFRGFREPLNDNKRIENLSVAYWIRSNRYGDGYVGKSQGYDNYGHNADNWFYNPWATRSGWGIACHDTDGRAYGLARFDSGPNGIRHWERGREVIEDGFAWHHVVLIYDGGRKTFELYVDGEPTDKSRGSNPQLLKGLGEEDGIRPSNARLTIGGHITKQGQFQAFDELAIWSRPLTARQVKALYNNGYGAQIKLDK